MEHLETRALLASVMDTAGGDLEIALGANEQLAIASSGSTLTFTSAKTFTDVGVADASDFTAFGNSSLTLNDLNQYSQINVVDTAPGASVTFLNSGSNEYSNSIQIDLDNSAAVPGLKFNGTSAFGNSTLVANVDTAVSMATDSALTTVNGDITLEANAAGTATGDFVGIQGLNITLQTTGTGNISLSGKGGDDTSNSHLYGIHFNGQSSIRSTAAGEHAGTITLNGEGGDGTRFNQGVSLGIGASVTTVDGAIRISGTGGNGTDTANDGVSFSSGTISSTGTGSHAGTITIVGTGGTDPDGGTTGDASKGLDLRNSITSTDGAISMIGNGGIGGGQWWNTGLFIGFGATIQSTGTGPNAATITINGMAGQGGIGALLSDSNTTITSVDGDVSITGTGGNGLGLNNYGVQLRGIGNISSTGTGEHAASILIDGTGGTRSQGDMGVLAIRDTTSVSSVDGPISIVGKGGGGTSGGNRGVLFTDGDVSSSNGNVTIHGTGGAGNVNNYGVQFSQNATAEVTTGILAVTGVGGGNNSKGVSLHVDNTGYGGAAPGSGGGGHLISKGSGAIMIVATASSGEDDFGIEQDSTLGGPEAVGPITLTADSVQVLENAVVQSSGALAFVPRTAETTIGLGGGDGTLNFDDAELARLADGFNSITIGDVANGTGNGEFDTAVFTDPVIIAGDTFSDKSGTDISAPAVTILGNISPGQSPGALIIDGNVTLDGDSTLSLEIDGPNPGDSYDQLQILGADRTVDLAGISVDVGLDFSPTDGHQFTIVDLVEDSSSLSGSFDGLAEGSVLAFNDIGLQLSYEGGTGNDVVLTVLDPLPAGLTVETDGSVHVSESGSTDTFTVNLFSKPDSDVVLSITGNAADEVTLDLPTLTFTSSNWDTAQTVTVTGVDDLIVDGDQTAVVTISVNDENSDDAYHDLPDVIVEVKNEDNDEAGFQIEESDEATVVSENEATDAISVVLTRAPLTNVVITVVNDDETEVSVDKASLTFTAENWNTAQSVAVTGVNDDIVDRDQHTPLVFSINDEHSDNAFDDLPNVVVEVKNEDNDEAGFRVEESDEATVVSENETTDTVAVALTKAPLTDVVIGIAHDDDSEIGTHESSLTFTAENWNTAQLLTVTGVDDDIVDGDQHTPLVFSISDEHSDNAFDDLPNVVVEVKNEDNDEAGFRIEESDEATVVSEDETTDSIAVVLTAGPLSDVVIAISSDDETEAKVDETSLTFTPQNWHTTQIVTVSGVDDDIVDGDQHTPLRFRIDDDHSDDAFDHLSDAVVEVTTKDNDEAGIVSTESDGSTRVSETGTTDTVSISLTGRPIGPVVLTVNSEDSGEFTTDHSSLTFTPNNWNTSQTIAVTGIDDSIFDGNQDSSLILAIDAANSHDSFTTVPEQKVKVVTADDEGRPGILVEESDGATSVSEEPTTDTIDVHLSGQPAGPVAVTFISRDTTEVDVVQETLTFTSENWNQAQTVILTGVDDKAFDGAQETIVDIAVLPELSDPGYHEAESQTVAVVTIDDEAVIGDIDNDVDFDANDSFLIHLLALAGTDAQTEAAKGGSLLTADQIRTFVSVVQTNEDVDGDQDFDANDSFLIHLVQLSGTDFQINVAKGTSPLTSQQIRSNVAALGSSDGVLQSNPSAVDLNAIRVRPRRTQTDVAEQHLQGESATFNESQPTNELEFSGNEFRKWIDSI